MKFFIKDLFGKCEILYEYNLLKKFLIFDTFQEFCKIIFQMS